MTPLLSSALLRTQSDARLVALAARGQERAFEAIVERYRKPLHRWCRRVLPEARAEDAVQTTFLKAWSALEAGTQVDDLKPWLYRIARNAALDNARKAGYDYDELTEALGLSPAPDVDLERRTVIRETLTGVADLPDNQRQALLRTASGHSRAEIARDLQVTEGAVRQLVHRARTTLRAAATAVTPVPLVSWASALGADAGAPASQRIAELAAGAGSAGIASTAVKAGTVVVAAGVLAVGPGSDLRREVAKDTSASAAASRSGGGHGAGDERGAARGAAGEDHRGQGLRRRGGRGHGRGERGHAGRGRESHRGERDGREDDRSGSSRSGSDESEFRRSRHEGGDDHSGSSGSGSGEGGSRSGTSESSSGSGDDGGGSGTSGSGSDGSATSGFGFSGSGSSGSGSGEDYSGSSGSGSGTSGSGSSSGSDPSYEPLDH